MLNWQVVMGDVLGPCYDTVPRVSFDVFVFVSHILNNIFYLSLSILQLAATCDANPGNTNRIFRGDQSAAIGLDV